MGLIQEPETCIITSVERGKPFVIHGEPGVKVLCRVIGDCGCRGAANAACVVLATESEGPDEVSVGTMISLPTNIRVQPLKLVSQPEYKRV